jgi:hydroxymethylbilane synthase
LTGLIGSPAGDAIVRGQRSGGRGEATALGAALARELLERGGRAILDAVRLGPPPPG